MDLIDQIDKQKIPRHVAVIMDGNGRWAKQHGNDRIYGHMHGVESVRAVLQTATELGVSYLTLYAFSAENWNRPKEEVDALMDLLVQTIMAEVDELDKNGVKLVAIGDIENMPLSCQVALSKGIEQTQKNSRITLVLALSYSGRWELSRAIKQIIADGVKAEDVNDALIEQYLNTREIPHPELLIRTSGERRISNFLLWQIAYSELYFTDTHWPDFRRDAFLEAIIDYQKRERRFGKTSEQLTI